MDVKLEDGTVVTNVPEGTTRSQLMARLGKATPQPRQIQPQQPESFMDKAALAADRGLSKVGDVAANLLPGGAAIKWGAPDILPNRQDVVDTATGASSLMRGTANQIGQKTGIAPVKGYGLGDFVWPTNQSSHSGWETFGKAIDPVALAIGSKAKYAKVLGGTAKDAAIALLKNAATGSATGSTIGTLSDDGTALEGAVTGAATSLLGPLIEGGSKAFGAVKNVLDPFLSGGTERAASKTAKTLVGDRKAAILQALDNPDQFVPNSPVTAGEAAAKAGSAEFSGLETALKPSLPSAYNELAQNQNQARLDLLRQVGRDKPALDAAIAQRSQIADPLYAAARANASPVNTTQIIGNIDDLMKKNPGNRELIVELSNVKNGLVGANGPRTNAEQVASVMDGLKAAIADEKNKFILGNLVKLKNDIATAIPGYQQAQQVFAAESKPINQMQVGQYLEDKLASPMAEYGNEVSPRAALYAQALRDAPGTIKRSVGKTPYQELGQVLSPDQLDKVKNVGMDLGRSAENSRLGNLGAAKARQILGQIEPPLPSVGMISPKYSVVRAASNRLHGMAQGKSIDYLAESMKDPKKMAELLRMADPQTQKLLTDFLKTYQPAMTAGMVNVSQGE